MQKQIPGKARNDLPDVVIPKPKAEQGVVIPMPKGEYGVVIPMPKGEYGVVIPKPKAEESACFKCRLFDAKADSSQSSE